MARLNDKHVFAVWGPPGGGKTTVAVNMATVLASSGHMVCLVSATDHAELQTFFNATIPKNKGIYAALSNGHNVREALWEARDNLFLLEMDSGGDAFDIVNISQTQVRSLMVELRDQFNFIIIDCTSHKESVFTGLGLVEADKVVVPIPHRASAGPWHIANTQMLEAIGAKIVYVDNDTRGRGCSMEQVLLSAGLPACPVKCRYVPEAYEWEAMGEPIVTHGGRGKAFLKSIQHLLSLLIQLEDDDQRALRKKELAQKRKGPPAAATTDADDDDGGLEEVEPASRRGKKDIEGRTRKNLSPRQLRKAEEDAMRRAKADAMRRFSEKD